jgi:hypothetical protein
MPYSTTVSGLDLSNGVPDVRVSAGYTYTDLTGTSPEAPEVRLDQVTLDIPTLQFQSTNPFSYAGSLLPIPDPTWSTAIWIQEIPRITNGTGWLFRSGRFTTEPPSDPIEIILAPEQLLGNAELASSVGALPTTSGTTTITFISLAVVGKDIAVTAKGTDTHIPHNDSFTFTGTMELFPSGSLRDVTEVFDIRLRNTSISFTSGTGHGFVTAVLNAVSGIISGSEAQKIKESIRSRLNAGVLTSVATQLNKGVPSSMPAGVVLSIRSIEATTRPLGNGTEAVIGVRAALAAFGGVTNKFPALSSGGSTCFIATAAAGPNAPEVETLRAWRDGWLRQRVGGVRVISLYEMISPPLAGWIAGSQKMRAVVRATLVRPTARWAKRLMRRA